MTEEIIIDVDNCPHKRDDDCMEVPICNEYGDLMGYQSCEAQTLCPYRSQKKIERLEQENKELKEEKQTIKSYLGIEAKTILERLGELDEWKHNDKLLLWKYSSALEDINKIAEEGLQSICYKANCATCRCYSKKISNDTLENIIKDYFDEDGDFTDTEGDFFEVLQAFIDRERVACNKAQPISEKIIDKINEVLGCEQ